MECHEGGTFILHERGGKEECDTCVAFSNYAFDRVLITVPQSTTKRIIRSSQLNKLVRARLVLSRENFKLAVSPPEGISVILLLS